jgi:hypothetical protein
MHPFSPDSHEPNHVRLVSSKVTDTIVRERSRVPWFGGDGKIEPWNDLDG